MTTCSVCGSFFVATVVAKGLIDETGELKISGGSLWLSAIERSSNSSSGKISAAVDECPVNGNHLRHFGHSLTSPALIFCFCTVLPVGWWPLLASRGQS